eukprot:scaffold9024_cov191-Isochrysis_galbana.AAC.2
MQTCHRTRSGARHFSSTVRDVSKTGKAEGETGRTESDITREINQSPSRSAFVATRLQERKGCGDGFSLSPTKMGLTPPLEVGVEETNII